MFSAQPVMTILSAGVICGAACCAEVLMVAAASTTAAASTKPKGLRLGSFNMVFRLQVSALLASCRPRDVRGPLFPRPAGGVTGFRSAQPDSLAVRVESLSKRDRAP